MASPSQSIEESQENARVMKATSPLCPRCKAILSENNYDFRHDVGICNECYDNLPNDFDMSKIPFYKMTLEQRNKRIKLKRGAIDAYGGKCKCCGEIHIELLTIDHVFNDGAVHRKQLGKKSIYEWLKEQNYPKVRFRVLCFNCNYAFGIYHYCPHNPDLDRRTPMSMDGVEIVGDDDVIRQD